MAVKCRKDAHAEETYYVKGSLDSILERSTHVLVRNGEAQPIIQAERERIQTVADSFASEGYRVLALAAGHDLNRISLIGKDQRGRGVEGASACPLLPPVLIILSTWREFYFRGGCHRRSRAARCCVS